MCGGAEAEQNGVRSVGTEFRNGNLKCFSWICV